MFGKTPHLTPLEARKRLLLAESELNRAQLVQELVAISVGVRTLTDRVKSFGSIASATALLVTGIAALRRGKVGHTNGKPSWLQMIRRGVGLVSSLWPVLRAKRPDHEINHPASRA